MALYPIPPPAGHKPVASVGHMVVYAPYRIGLRVRTAGYHVLPAVAPLGIVGHYKTHTRTLGAALRAAAGLTAMIGKVM